MQNNFLFSISFEWQCTKCSWDADIIYAGLQEIIILIVQFVIDVSNRHQVSAACILLLEVLGNKMLASAPTLIVLNKW